MTEIVQKDSIFFIEKKPYLNRKRNISLDNQLTLNNSQISQEQLFQIDTSKSNFSNTGETTNIPKPILKKGKWSEEEDNLLIKYINKFGVGKWNKIERYLIGRSRKQIRQRYISNIKIKKISEEIKSNITSYNYNSESSSDEESYQDKEIIQKGKDNVKIEFKWSESLDQILLKEYLLNKKSWVKISRKIPGSSENSVKNRFYSLLRQKANRAKKAYRFTNIHQIENNDKNNNNLILLVKKEISGNINNLNKEKEMIFKNLESENKSKKKNYSVDILLEFLPELLMEKGIDISEILGELNKRKSTAAQKIFIIIEKHFDSYKNGDNNDYSSISTDIEFDNLQNLQSEKLGNIIKNMKLKIMYKYFHRFRYNTLGI